MKTIDMMRKTHLIKQFVTYIFPKVDKKLEQIYKRTKAIPDSMLSEQAINSIKMKRFHCLGGSIYALYPGVDHQIMIDFIVSYQTISDYLDNLCDRAQICDERAFRHLHLAIIDALDPSDEIKNYYKYYPYKDDGGYLTFLVCECKKNIRKLPSHELVKDELLFLAKLYSDLQVYKHLDLDLREDKMKQWFKKSLKSFPDISGWEFSAATGSTLGIFSLIAVAMDRELMIEEVREISKAYFPWICGLHILLDYYIDLYEDIEEGDLNFVNYYKNRKECEKRLKLFYKRAKQSSQSLKNSLFHQIVVEGLMAMYLSDPKAYIGKQQGTTKTLLRSSDFFVQLLHFICKILRTTDSFGDFNQKILVW